MDIEIKLDDITMVCIYLYYTKYSFSPTCLQRFSNFVRIAEPNEVNTTDISPMIPVANPLQDQWIKQTKKENC